MEGEPTSRLARNEIVILFCFVAPFAASFIVLFFPEPAPPAEPRAAVRQLADSGLDDEARALVLRTLRGSKEDPGLHHDLLEVYFERLHTSAPPDSSVKVTDAALLRLYQGRIGSEIQRESDVAAFALGEYWRHKEDEQKALDCYARVSDRSLPYLSRSQAAALRHLGYWSQAETMLRREIALGHDVAGATEDLATLYVADRRWRGLDSLLADPALARHVPSEAVEVLRLRQLRLIHYLGALLHHEIYSFRWMAVLLALYGSLIWFLLVRWWDVFEKEPVALSVAVVLLGAAATSLIVVSHDVMRLLGAYHFDKRDPVDWIVVVGMQEEAVKILPIAAVYLLTKAIDEPVDWMIYASLSALGFSVVENCGYISREGLQLSTLRIFLATPVHVAWTGFLALCIPVARQRGRSVAGALLLGFLLVSTAHGLSDYFAQIFPPLSIALDLTSVVAFMQVMQRVHGLSPFRGLAKDQEFICTHWFVAAYALLCIVILFINATHLRHAEAGKAFMFDFVGLVIPLGFMSFYSHIKIARAGSDATPRPT